MATMNLVKAAMVSVVLAGSVGTAMASEPVASAMTSEVVASASNVSSPDGTGQDSGLQAYCYWQTYCDFYGYCWTNWVCF